MTSDSAVRQLLQVPGPGTLYERQVRGQACVWCAVVLCTAAAVDLGQRDGEFDGTVVRWFPRSCRRCAIRHVYSEQLDHTQNCEQCTDDPALCAHGRWLRLVVRQTRR
ncbi:hypothetical protein ACWCOW_37160 [Streptomyces sp. NPDC001939]